MQQKQDNSPWLSLSTIVLSLTDLGLTAYVSTRLHLVFCLFNGKGSFFWTADKMQPINRNPNGKLTLVLNSSEN